MKNANFVHLHLHSSHSLLDGLGKVDEYAKKASELGFTHLAITDHGNVNGAIKFQRVCEKYGIKPLIGAELYVVEDATVKDKNNGHMVVLVKNEQGWQNLLKMLSYAHLKGFFYKPRISYETILNHHEGLIITSACAHSWILQKNGRKLLCELLEKKSNEDIYLEIMPHNDKMTMEANSRFISLSNKFDIPLISTIDAHYVNKEDADAHEVLLAIQRGAKWNDKDRWKFSVKTLYLQSADEMILSFEKQNAIDPKVYTRAIRNTLEVAILCEDFKIEPKIPKLPRVKGIKKEDEEKKLRELCVIGFIEKIGEFVPVEYETRIDYEISVLKEKKAIRYFLLVWDLVNWCRENDILCSSRGCFTGDTKISLLDGTERTFFELAKDFKNKEFWVYSCLPNGEIVPGLAKNPRKTKSVIEICKVTLDNNEVVSSTPDHRFLMKDGTYKKAKDLLPNDSLMPLYRRLDKLGYEQVLNLRDSLFKYTHYLSFKKRRGHVIHHKDFNKRNNNLDNLLMMNSNEHIMFHASLTENTIKRNKDPEFRKKVSVGQKRVWSNPEYRSKMLMKLNNDETSKKKAIICIERNKSQKMRDITKNIERTQEWSQRISGSRKEFFKTPLGKKEIERIRTMTLGRKLSEETKAKLSKSKTGKTLSEEHKRKISESSKGRKNTWGDKISKALMGRKFSDTHKANISKSRKHSSLSDEVKNKISISLKKKWEIDKVNGIRPKIMSEETRKKRSEIAKRLWRDGIFTGISGRKLSEEARKKISETSSKRCGWHHTEETKKKISSIVKLKLEEKNNNLKSDDQDNHRVISVETVNERCDVYDIEVENYHNFALSSGVFVHNSVGCSLTAFLLGLTEIDPILYHLPFSRFLNEERIDLPDIDLDLPDNKRHLVTARLHELYGENYVAGISTFNRMKARGVIRDVARVFDIAINEVDWFAKLIDTSINDALETEAGEEFARKYPKIMKYAQALENTEKSLGRHAAGKIISSEDLTLGTRAYLCMREDELTVNWEGEDCEHQGLIKLDILGLNTLTVIAETISLIKKNHNQTVNFFKILLNDPDIYKELSEGRFAGIFQMGYAVRNLVNEMGVSNIKEWSDAVALARPGPLDSGMSEEYVKRKRGADWEKKHELYEELLKETYGVVCYQEQVMNIIHKVAGLSYATADKIRKVIGKKRDAKEFEPYRKEFMKGCLKSSTLSQDEAEEFWEGLLKHSRYSFNNSHSLSYAILGYKCLWLLRYFPLEFICAALSYGTDKIKEEMLDEARKINIKIVPPKYGISTPKEWIVKNQKLYAPYVMIKGIGEKLAEEINYEPVKKKKGFFSSSSNTELKPKVRTILEAINAFNLDSDELPDEANIYFDIDFNKFISHDDLIIQKQDPYEINEDLFECSSCELCNECDRQVPPSPSKYNLMIIGEAPGKDEDKIGKGFTGKAGKLLWEELAKHKLLRQHFHTTNTTKCFPSKSHNPSEKQVNICSKWLDEEINFVKPAIILALGNMAMYQMRGESKGIMRMNGQIEWNSKYNTFVLFCVHPALILRNSSYHEMFSKSIEILANKIKEMWK